ncbi:MAG: undecaprenyl-diphosphate phosphatase, partial [Muribaculaceae bacterium]|nr:undecaprenyl-diphosphate phosphatase [Muribaculaceae bacterium]
MTEKRALMVGLFQCISMIPGMSRSMATIVGGMAQKMTRKAAAEFSFFLAVPTMLGATVYKCYKLIKEDPSIITDNMTTLIIGNVVAFIVAVLAIKFFINFVSKHGFKAFGWYRIIIGGAILIMIACGIDLQIM